MACNCQILVDTSAGPMHVPGGQCLQCRIQKQKSLTWRSILEDRMTIGGSEFWTLTYADAPEKGDWTDFSLFFKRFRQIQARNLGNRQRIRFLGCGEYGEKSGRFHYHALIFNTVPTPAALHTRLWPHGFVYIGTVTPQSIRYTARYTLKFGAKGKEAVANWSKSPPLGDVGMRAIVRQLLKHGHTLTDIPSYMQHDGKFWPLDEAMRLSFASELTGKPVKLLRSEKYLSRPAATWLKQRVQKILEPEEIQRQSEYNSEFWARIRLHYGKL